MLLRLFLCVLLAALGCSAAATDCHAAPATRMTMAAGAPMQHRHDAAAPHACIGCIPPEMLRAATPAAPLCAVALPGSYPFAVLYAGAAAPPALPPPRR
jgi:hypothetical protein